MKTIDITEDIQNTWIWQDAKKLKWWIDLQILADDDGKIRMSLADLAYRWSTDRATVSRFLSRLSATPLCNTSVQHQMQQITICKAISYTECCNTACNTSVQHSKEIPPVFPHTPFITPKENNNLSSPTGARDTRDTHIREETPPWNGAKEKAYKENFLATGGCGKVARLTGKGNREVAEMLSMFEAKCELGNHGHRDIYHYSNHFVTFVRNPANSAQHGSREGMTTTEYLMDIANELGL